MSHSLQVWESFLPTV